MRKKRRALGLQLHVLTVSTESEFDSALGTLARRGRSALLVGSDVLYFVRREQLAALAAQHALPPMTAEDVKWDLDRRVFPEFFGGPVTVTAHVKWYVEDYAAVTLLPPLVTLGLGLLGAWVATGFARKGEGG
jgi:hypothetical protein